MAKERGENASFRASRVESRPIVDVGPKNVSMEYRVDREPQRAYHGAYPRAPQA